VAVFDEQHQLITGMSDDFLLHKTIRVLKNHVSPSTRIKMQGCRSKKYTSWSNINMIHNTSTQTIQMYSNIPINSRKSFCIFLTLIWCVWLT